MRVVSDLYFPQLGSLACWDVEESDSVIVWIQAMTEEEQKRFSGQHGNCLCGSKIDAEESWLCNSTLQMSVCCGRKIRYHLKDGGDAGYLRTYLLGFGMAMLSLQREMLPFHCSALEAPQGGGILIAGESGAGKSTLTAGLLQQGYRFLADDMAVVDPSQKSYVVGYPGFPYLKLCPDAAQRQGIKTEKLVKIDEKKDKFLVPYTGKFSTEGIRIKMFILLRKSREEDSDEVKVEKIMGAGSMVVYKENLFLRHLWKKQNAGMEVWQNCLRMAEKIPVYCVERPAAGDSTARVAAEVHSLQQIFL